MNIIQKIKDTLKSPHKPSVGFYETAQKYTVSFSAEIRNNDSEERSCRIVFPIPFSDAFQECGDVLFFPQGNVRAHDPVHNNTYAYWKILLAPKNTAVIRENFEVLARPRRIAFDEVRGTLEDYAAFDQTLVGRHMHSNRFVSGEDERIKKIAGAIAGSEKNIAKIITSINKYTISRLFYGNPIKGLYSFSDALEKEKVDCGGFDTLLVSLLIAAGVPARVVSGFFAGYPGNSMHAWAEALLPDGRWFPLDPSIEKLSGEKKTKKSGRAGFTGSDRIALSVGCDIRIIVDGVEHQIDILQNPVIFADGREKDFSLRVNFSTQ
ncbi:MAG: transglutaminase family protein [Candidatus Sungbacteria bacterium]|nr:transglutaminase family protein [Candidatus Sungbacteria bacterium]